MMCVCLRVCVAVCIRVYMTEKATGKGTCLKRIRSPTQKPRIRMAKSMGLVGRECEPCPGHIPVKRQLAIPHNVIIEKKRRTSCPGRDHVILLYFACMF